MNGICFIFPRKQIAKLTKAVKHNHTPINSRRNFTKKKKKKPDIIQTINTSLSGVGNVERDQRARKLIKFLMYGATEYPQRALEGLQELGQRVTCHRHL